LQGLHQMDSPEARWVLSETLRTTSVPSEIARIASYLEEEAPGQFRAEVSEAATETLALAAKGELADWDVGPIYHIADGSLEAIEKHADQWSHYSALALANMPAGLGIPRLSRLAEDENGVARPAAVQALAQSSFFYPEASEALVKLAREGKFREEEWTSIIGALSGERHYILNTERENTPLPENPGAETFYIASSKERYFSLAGSMSPEQIDERVGVIDQLLEAPADQLLEAPAAPHTKAELRAARDKLNQARTETPDTALIAQ
jgi:hypothetical protein